jgi:DNA processing protein
VTGTHRTAPAPEVDSAAAAVSAPGEDPDLVRRVIALVAARAADPERLRRAVARELDAGRELDAAGAVAALERGAATEPARAAALTHGLLRVGARTCLVGGPCYPSRLAAAWPDLGAPLWLFTHGPAGRLPDGPAVAVVGTRQPTLDGAETARALGRLLARHGVTVVSGMARGIDQEAHRGALDENGATVGVLGAGLDVDYPKGDGELRAQVAAAGGLATELPPGAGPRAPHFLWRNRIIAGLADATVVVEGRVRSGALQTARLAAAQGREVLAVPGPLRQPTARAPLDLIRDGARCLTRLEDVLEVVGVAGGQQSLFAGAGAADRGSTVPGSGGGLSADACAVRELLGAVPATPGALAAAAGLSVPAVLAAVSELLHAGQARQAAAGVTRAPTPG